MFKKIPPISQESKTNDETSMKTNIENGKTPPKINGDKKDKQKVSKTFPMKVDITSSITKLTK